MVETTVYSRKNGRSRLFDDVDFGEEKPIHLRGIFRVRKPKSVHVRILFKGVEAFAEFFAELFDVGFNIVFYKAL
jgi:hypothetical protein